MVDDVVMAFRDVMVSFIDEFDKILDSILDDMTPEEYRMYARLGFICALKYSEECENMDDKLITEE